MADSILQQAFDILHEDASLDVSAATRQQLADYLALIRQWNSPCSLVSQGDALQLEDKHLVDALSLAPHVLRCAGRSGHLLDIGSGGGFPAVPLKCLLPNLRCTLVEHSVRKVGFLHRAVVALRLEGVAVIHGSFPEVPGKVIAGVITARAVEQPRRVVPAILQRMPMGSVFLCQTEPIGWRIPPTFHVEHVNDSWKQAGLRRGELYLITNTAT